MLNAYQTKQLIMIDSKSEIVNNDYKTADQIWRCSYHEQGEV